MSFRQQGAVQPPTALDLLTAIGGTKSLSTLDGLARAIWTDWGAGRLTDEQASALAETLEGASGRCGGSTPWRSGRRRWREAAASGPPEPFPTQAEGGALAEPAGVDRAAPHAGGVRPHAAAARQPVHDRRAGGVADRRRRREGPRRLHADLGGDRGAGRRVRHHGAQRVATRPHRRGSSPSRSAGATSGRTSPMWCEWFRGNG